MDVGSEEEEPGLGRVLPPWLHACGKDPGHEGQAREVTRQDTRAAAQADVAGSFSEPANSKDVERCNVTGRCACLRRVHGHAAQELSHGIE